MTDPITLAAIGTSVLTEGIKFLYQQAGELLKRWRERRAIQEKTSNASSQIQVVPVNLPAQAFEGQLREPRIHFDVIEKLEPQLRETRQELSAYADETDPVEISNKRLLANVDALRQILEAVYQQRITFKGEHRPASGPTVEGKVDVERVQGYVAGVRLQTVAEGSIRGELKVGEVGPGGVSVAVDIGTFGKK